MKAAFTQAFIMYAIAFVISMGVAFLITVLFRFLKALRKEKE